MKCDVLRLDGRDNDMNRPIECLNGSASVSLTDIEISQWHSAVEAKRLCRQINMTLFHLFYSQLTHLAHLLAFMTILKLCIKCMYVVCVRKCILRCFNPLSTLKKSRLTCRNNLYIYITIQIYIYI